MSGVVSGEVRMRHIRIVGWSIMGYNGMGYGWDWVWAYVRKGCSVGGGGSPALGLFVS